MCPRWLEGRHALWMINRGEGAPYDAGALTADTDQAARQRAWPDGALETFAHVASVRACAGLTGAHALPP